MSESTNVRPDTVVTFVDPDRPWDALELEAIDAFLSGEGDDVEDQGGASNPGDLAQRVLQRVRDEEKAAGEALARPGRRRALVAAAAVVLGVWAGVWWLQSRATQGDGDGVIAGPPIAVEDRARTREPLPANLARDVESYVGQFGRRYGVAFEFSGVVVVARGDDTVVLGFGRRGVLDEALPGEHTQFRVGALTQPMVAVAAERMARRDELDFEASIRHYLPELPERWQAVRVEDLIRHQSGIASFTDTLPWTFARGSVHEPHELWAYVAGEGLKFSPGTDFEASNTNYVILGEILARVSGSSLDEVLRKEVFVPSRMKGARVGLGDEPTSAKGMSFDEDEILVPAGRVAPSAYAGAGAVVASASDLIAFHRALESERLLDARRQREMYKGNGQYGRGWVSRWLDGDFEVSHPGGIDGFNAQIVRRLSDGTMVAVLANTDAVDARVVAQGVMQLAQGESAEPVLERVERPIPAERMDDYDGVYELSAATRARLARQFGRGAKLQFERVSIVRRAGTLWMDVPDHGRKWLHGLGDDAFFFKDRAGTLATFTRGGDGEVERLVLRVGETEMQLTRTAARR